MFQSLPIEIHEIIYKKLHVRDRVKFLYAIPKEQRHKIKIYSNYFEKKLGVLSKAIEQNKIKKLSHKMIDFLKNYDKEDQTLQDMSKVFPEITSIEHKSKSIIEKIKDGSITDLEADTVDIFIDAHKEALYKCSPLSFMVLWKKIGIQNWMTMNDCYLFNLFNYGNKELLEFFKKENIYDWPWDKVREYIYTHKNILLRVRKLAFTHFIFSKDELESLWEFAMSEMDIDASLDIEELMKK